MNRLLLINFYHELAFGGGPPFMRVGAMGWLVGKATQVALLLATFVSCPNGLKGEEIMRCDTPLLAIDATSKA